MRVNKLLLNIKIWVDFKIQCSTKETRPKTKVYILPYFIYIKFTERQNQPLPPDIKVVVPLGGRW